MKQQNNIHLSLAIEMCFYSQHHTDPHNHHINR